MSDAIKHECGIALLQLKKPLSFYKEKYGSSLYGLDKMYLLMEKQHNRGQDGAGFASIKYNMKPGQRYISRVRSAEQQPIQDIFNTINSRIQKQIDLDPDLLSNSEKLKQDVPYVGELMLGHVRYGTFGKNNIESVHPFLRQNNWMHRNLIVAGNFNLTNVNELFDNLVDLGQHPKEMADTVTVMEKIGHFLDYAVAKIYKKLKREGYSKAEASPLIAERLNLSKILRKAAKNWDGGYAVAGLLGHGDSFVLRDPNGIRPVYYYNDDEIIVVTSERPVIQTVFNVPFESIQELEPGMAVITKKSGDTEIKQILAPQLKRACSFERIYFSRGSDAEIYQERKNLGAALFPMVHKAIEGDLENSVFSFIPNTAETSFYGMIGAVQDHVRDLLTKSIKKDPPDIEAITKMLGLKPRIEKIAIKDAKLRTFITEDKGRDDLVAHVYDITYGIIKNTDNLVIIDDSIVRGTTLQKSILQMLDRLGPKKIVVVSSAPQIRYPDCYGIDMAKLEEFIAFRAALSLHKDKGTYEATLKTVYENCKESLKDKSKVPLNYVKQIYDPFTDDQISIKIAQLLKNNIKAEVNVIFQKLSGLHKACPKNLGDWYFSGNYPTPGGCRVVNQAFINFIEKSNKRAY
ncbi:amidophosphoribosyltransferase [Flavobacteriaceae bacterium]|nr:amidophosphoribosyltransferase [Flavobacteriaceae bacterium]MDB4062467.1 amidophosphoribosyltransferase [Flavobacteriaceae bacterium]MDB4255029.1 amidophosphoribosyltransferase [Flavobacteriaceae bacterium]